MDHKDNDIEPKRCQKTKKMSTIKMVLSKRSVIDKQEENEKGIWAWLEMIEKLKMTEHQEKKSHDLVIHKKNR